MTAGIEVAPFQWTVVQLAGSSAVRCSGSAVEGIPDRGSGRPDLAATRSPQKPAQARGAAASGGHPLQRAKENKLTEARGSAAQRRGEREPDDRDQKNIFDAEPTGEPASPNGIMIAAQTI